MRPKTTAASRYTAERWYSSREISSPAPASTSPTDASSRSSIGEPWQASSPVSASKRSCARVTKKNEAAEPKTVKHVIHTSPPSSSPRLRLPAGLCASQRLAYRRPSSSANRSQIPTTLRLNHRISPLVTG